MAQILFNFIAPLRWIFMAIDSILFGLVDACYKLIVSFANAELFTMEQIAEIRTKIYFIITLVAFFRLAFLLINSLINPEKLSDKNEGLSKIAFNFVIMLVLLVITPIIFDAALELQKDIVNENVITGIFTLSKEDGYTCKVDQSDLDKVDIKNYKKYDKKTKTWVEDREKYEKDLEHKKAAVCSSAEMKSIVIGSLIYPDNRIAREENGTYEIIDDSKCKGKCEEAVEEYNTMIKNRNFKFTKLEKYIGVTTKIDDSEVFAYNYTLLLTTVCSGFMLYILLSFAFDLGKRLLEMNLLMLLSPLFIATYVDPKSAKSGPFNNWLKAFGKSYAGLFLRLAALSIMMLFVKMLSINKAGLEPIGGIGFIVLLFAGLTFCKELPKWISELLGMKDGAMGGLGLGKKITGTPLLGGLAKKAGLAATGAVAGAATALNARRREGRQRLKDARASKGVSGIKGLRRLGKGDFSGFARDRMAARRDSVKAGGGLPKTLAQYGAAGLLGAKSGGTTGIKADNIKGAFKGSVQTGRQTASSLGINGGETFGQKISGGFLSIENKMTDKAFGTFDERDKKAKKIENDRVVSSIAATSEITESGYGKGKIAMSRKDKKSIAETKAFGENDGVKTFEDYCASQYATTMFGENTAIKRISIDGKDAYSITDLTTGKNVSVTAEKLTDNNLNGLVQGVGMQYMAQNWYGIQSQGISNYQHADAAAKSASQLLQTIESQVSGLTSAVKSSVSSMGAVSDAVKTRMSNLDIKFDPSGKIQLDDANISKLGKYVESVKGDSKLDTSQKEALLAPLAGFADEASRLTATISQKERAQAELIAAEAEAKKYEFIYIKADGVTAEEKIATADKKASEAKAHIDASKPKDDKK